MKGGGPAANGSGMPGGGLPNVLTSGGGEPLLARDVPPVACAILREVARQLRVVTSNMSGSSLSAAVARWAFNTQGAGPSGLDTQQ